MSICMSVKIRDNLDVEEKKRFDYLFSRTNEINYYFKDNSIYFNYLNHYDNCYYSAAKSILSYLAIEFGERIETPFTDIVGNTILPYINIDDDIIFFSESFNFHEDDIGEYQLHNENFKYILMDKNNIFKQMKFNVFQGFFKTGFAIETNKGIDKAKKILDID